MGAWCRRSWRPALARFYSFKIEVIDPQVYFGADLLASVPLVFVIMHLCWAVGFFGGMFRFGIPRPSLSSVWSPLFSETESIPAGAASAVAPIRLSGQANGQKEYSAQLEGIIVTGQMAFRV